MALLTNAATPLITPTYDGAGQTVHPCVLDFGQGFLKSGATTWSGHRYWMANSPYPASNDQYENPCLWYSDDGITWNQPNNITSVRGSYGLPISGTENPLVSIEYWLPPVHSMQYCNDPHIIYIPETDELECWFGVAHYTQLTPTRIKGEYFDAWSVRVNSNLVVSPPIRRNDGSDANYLAMAVIRHPITGHYYKYDSGSCMRTDSADGITWSAYTAPATQHPWEQAGHVGNHFNAILREDLDTVDVLITTRLVTGQPTYMFFGRTHLSDHTRWEYPFGATPILASSSGWDYELYRPSFLIDEATKTMRLWYGAMNLQTPNVWHTGYTSGVLAELPDVAPTFDLDVHLEAIANVHELDVKLLNISDLKFKSLNSDVVNAQSLGVDVQRVYSYGELVWER